MLGIIERGSALQALATLPEMIWEGAILGVYVIVKGFNSKRAAELEGRAPATAPATAPGLAAA